VTAATTSAAELADQLEAVCGVGSVARLGRDQRQLRVQPTSAAEVAEIVALAARAGARVVAVGSGSSGVTALAGNRPLVQCDLRKLNHVLHLDEQSLTVHVQAGLTGVGLEQILAPRELTLGDFPPSALGSTLGGLLSVRTPGKASARAGTLEDAVLGVSAVLADGRTIHTRVAPRRASGPDLARALLGAVGTTGIITAVTLRIQRRAEARLYAAFLLPSFRDALAAVRLALHEEAAPAAVRVYDNAEAVIHLGDDVAPGGEVVLVVATAGPTDLAACDRDLFTSAVAASGGRPTKDEIALRWSRMRTGHDRRELPRPDLQVAVSPGRQDAVYQAVLARAAGRGARVSAHASRFALDGCVFFFGLGGDGALVRDASEAARAAGGALLGDLAPPHAALWRALVEELDPGGVLGHGLPTLHVVP
jgi:FAD/FMN-containing dehydrogenase